MRPELPRLHAITDERVARRPDFSTIAMDLARVGGAELAFHARGHELSGRELFELADRFAAQAPARLFVNDRLDVALATGAAGVQLRRGSLTPADARRLNPEWWIGLSVHDLEEAWAARTGGADYLLVGAVHATGTHPNRAPLTQDRLVEIVHLGLPVIAIGGVTPERVPELKRAGVYGVAAIRALWDAADPRAAAAALLQGLGARG